MTDREAKRQQRRVLNRLKAWIKLMGLEDWKITAEFAQGELHASNGERVEAYVESDWRYKQAHIAFAVDQVANMDDQGLDETIAHELGHCLVGPLSKPDAYDLEEMVVTTIQRALCRALAAT